jgi:3-hydroxyacyl-CoA dehydrogenase
MTTRYDTHGHVAVITLDNPPINSLGLVTREALDSAMQRALADDGIQAIVITGARGVFTGGADIREFGKPVAMQSPNLHELIAGIEASNKPVISAINGVCMGGGTEISLGCHYRVAAPGAMIGLPEVKLGLLPGAGGTQRLPRAAGVELALQMITTGEPVKAEVLAAAGAIDRVIAGDFLSGVLAFASEAVGKLPLPRVRDMKAVVADATTYFSAARSKVAAASKGFPAPLKCLETVEAAVLRDIDAGLAFEFESFLQLMATPESAALRHAFFAERAAGKIPDIAESTPVRDIKSVAVIGGGTMGGGITMNFLNAGLPVALLEMQQDALERGVATIRRNYENSVKKGKLSAEQLEQRMALLKPTLAYTDLAQADLIVEAVFEDMGVKQQVFAQIDAVARRGAILASNTSTLDLNKIAAGTGRPQDVIGLHFFSPANVMKLLEVVRGAATADDVLATAMKLARKIRKTAVVAGVCDGFIGNRMIAEYIRQSMFLLDEGASVEQVDRAMESFGMAMGPFRMGDLAGNDIGWAIRQRLYADKPHMKFSRVGDRLCEVGRFGQKAGAGWYDYVAGDRTPCNSPVVSALIAAYQAESGIAPRSISDAEIVERLVYALVNEGARLLEEGIALRASDIDIVYLTGYGFPLYRGGPMFHADQLGLANVVAAMRQFAGNPHADPAFWQPAPLLAKLAAQGKRFNAA